MRLRFVVLGWLCVLANSVSAQSAASTPASPQAPAETALAAPVDSARDAPQAASIEAPVGTPVPEPAQSPLAMPPSAAATESPAVGSEAPVVPGPSFLSKVQIHGFVSEGAFISTANEYIGESSRGSFKMLETGLNITLEPIDRLRVGLQLIARSVGTLSDAGLRLDWAVIDYRLRRWFGMRAGLIKMPLGLYNEFVDIDSARNAILLPQSLYPLRNRDALIAHLGFAVYGNVPLGAAGELEYQAWLGTLNVPPSALVISNNARFDSIDTRYVAGARLLWLTPLEGLRVGFTYLRTVIDFYVSLDADTTRQVIEAKIAPADYDGKLKVSQDPASFWVASAEYISGDWLFAAEYSRWTKHQEASIVALVQTIDDDWERMYAMVNYRLSSHFELGTYYSIVHADAHDRTGKDPQRFQKRFTAFQRDLTATLRVDINQYWLWKLEAHVIDGTAELLTTVNPDPTRLWGLFLIRTTVTF